MKTEKPWPVPDLWQCEYVEDDGRRCILSKTHTVEHRPKICLKPEGESDS